MAKAAATTEANRLTFERLTQSDPVLVDVRAVPGFARNIILTSGPPMAWTDYSGGQRDAIIGGALFEGLAKDRDEAIAKLDAGEIEVGACHDFGCVGSLAGIYTASMPAFVVENRAFGNVACCNIYEGSNPRRRQGSALARAEWGRAGDRRRVAPKRRHPAQAHHEAGARHGR